MPDFVTDTHSLIWYLENNPRLGTEASKAFDACDLGYGVVYVPTICLVEIAYLQEKGRVSADLKAKMDEALQSGTSSLIVVALTIEVANAVSRVPRVNVPDMPDRIIAATALHLGLPLISRDHKIQLSGINTIW